MKGQGGQERMKVATIVLIVLGVIIWLLPSTYHDPFAKDRAKAAAQEKSELERAVDKLCAMPRIQIVIRRNDGPTSLMACGCVPDNIYTERVLVAAFNKINPGARLWVGDKVWVPDYVEGQKRLKR